MELLDGKYQIDQLLGQGGMGAVYRATHLGTKSTLRDASDQFEALDIPRSRWQARMRSRWNTHTSRR